MITYSKLESFYSGAGDHTSNYEVSSREGSNDQPPLDALAERSLILFGQDSSGTFNWYNVEAENDNFDSLNIFASGAADKTISADVTAGAKNALLIVKSRKFNKLYFKMDNDFTYR